MVMFCQLFLKQFILSRVSNTDIKTTDTDIKFSNYPGYPWQILKRYSVICIHCRPKVRIQPIFYTVKDPKSLTDRFEWHSVVISKISPRIFGEKFWIFPSNRCFLWLYYKKTFAKKYISPIWRVLANLWLKGVIIYTYFAKKDYYLTHLMQVDA